MKKSIKKIIIFSIALILFLIILSGAFYLKMNSEIGKMAPLATGKIMDDIFTVKDGFVNLYFVKADKKYFAFDAGTNPVLIEKEMKKINISPGEVAALFLTHTDGDHVGAVQLFKNAKVYLSKAEEQMVNGKTSRFFIFKNMLNVPYILLGDNEKVKINNSEIQLLLTPGHTPGSASYLVNKKYLFTGDTMALKNGEMTLFNEFFNMDSKTEEKSIKKISELDDIRYIFTAHYGYSKGKARGQKN